MGSNLDLDHQIAVLAMLRPVTFAPHSQVNPIENPLGYVDRLLCCFVQGAYSLASGTRLLVLALPIAAIALHLSHGLAMILHNQA